VVKLDCRHLERGRTALEGNNLALTWTNSTKTARDILKGMTRGTVKGKIKGGTGQGSGAGLDLR